MNSVACQRKEEGPRCRTRIRAHSVGIVIAVPLYLLVFSSGCGKGGMQRGMGQVPANPVTVAEAVQKDVPLEIKAIGSVQAYSTVQIKAQVGGQMVNVHFEEGQDVRKGDLLFKLDSRPFEIALAQAESNLARDIARMKNAQDEVARYAGLAEKDYVTKERYEELRVNAEVLEAVIKADRAAVDGARLEVEYCTLVSPIDGRTGNLIVHPGNLVKANDTQPLVVINQIVPVFVVFSVPEQGLPLVKKSMAAGALQTEAELKSGGSAMGVLTFVDNAIDPATGTIQLKATFPNKDRALWPGQFVSVTLTLTIEKNKVVVPSRAVQTSQDGLFVMIVKSDLTVEARTVEVERTAGEDSVIGKGLAPGETVVTDGLLRLVPGSKVAVKSEL